MPPCKGRTSKIHLRKSCIPKNHRTNKIKTTDKELSMESAPFHHVQPRQ